MTDKPVVTIFGANDPQPGQEAYQTALAVGETLAQMEYDIANGGYGGTMEASARGAKLHGARTIGVTCSLWTSSPNAYIDDVIETASLPERIQTLIDLGRGGYVVLPGATGTLSELAWVWELSCKGFLDRRPIVCVGTFWQPLIEMMAAQRPCSRPYVALAESPSKLEETFARR